MAEVLIVLGTIGTIAAFTLPSLIANIQDAQYKTAYKKAFSFAQQAVTNARMQDLFVENTDGAANRANFLAFMSQFKTVKQCLYVPENCWVMNNEAYGKSFSDGYPNTSSCLAFVDSSGFVWVSGSYNSSSFFYVDTNGDKGPNQWGKDRFTFLRVDENEGYTGLPIKVKPLTDNYTNVCYENKCGTVGDPYYGTYFGTSWLYK